MEHYVHPFMVLVTGDIDGVVRVGPITGEEPHLLFGHEDIVMNVAIHPELKWIASSDNAKPTVRLWPMPKRKPLHTQPYNVLLKTLKSLTNVRIVPDEKNATGYKPEIELFQVGETLPNGDHTFPADRFTNYPDTNDRASGK